MGTRHRSSAARLAVVGFAFVALCRGQETPAASVVDAALGLQLFVTGQSLWEEDAATVAARLGLRRGSNAADTRFWRSLSATVFGLPAEEVRLLEGEEGRPVGVELNLINKGDYFAPPSVRRRLDELYRDEPRKLAKASATDPNVQRDLGRLFSKDLLACEKAAQQALTAALGAPHGQTFQQVERKRVQRWDWQGSAFLLDARKGEFVMVRILPRTQADEHGRSERRTDSAVKQDLAANVARESNGDVWIRNIPMVDQGEKGYCAVATAERILRYYGISVDSHDLAEAAGTAKGGGTTWDGMCMAIKRIADRNQRSLRQVGALSNARAVGRYVDRGIPLIWGMFVTQEIEDAAHRRLQARQSVEAGEWVQRLKIERSATKRVKPDASGGHLRLIVGYNLKTGEIAYSDSWGDDRVYWLSEGEARLLSFPGTSLAAVVP